MTLEEINNLPEEDLLKVIAQKANELEPVIGEPTFEEQERRIKTYPFMFYFLARRLQAVIIKRDQRIDQLREQLIQVRKELSALKRNK